MSIFVEFLKNLYNAFPRRNQLKFFFLFVFISSFFWTFTKLSSIHTSHIVFSTEFIKSPDLISPQALEDKKIRLNLTSTGLQLFLYSFFKTPIKIDLEDAYFKENRGSVDLYKQKFQIENQLYEGTIINNIDPIKIEFHYSMLGKKKIKIIPDVDVSFRLGYDKFEDWKVEPDSVFVSGPTSIIDSLNRISTVFSRYENIDQDINTYIQLVRIHSSLNLEPQIVKVNLPVRKFTEKIFSTPINITNLPDTLSIKLFPQVVNVSFSVPLEKAESINLNDFSFSCNYLDSNFGKKPILTINLDNKPDEARKIKWNPKYINYLIRE